MQCCSLVFLRSDGHQRRQIIVTHDGTKASFFINLTSLVTLFAEALIIATVRRTQVCRSYIVHRYQMPAVAAKWRREAAAPDGTVLGSAFWGIKNSLRIVLLSPRISVKITEIAFGMKRDGTTLPRAPETFVPPLNAVLP
jgi:hypothetical protein